MADLLVHPAERPLAGTIPAPADRATAELGLLLAALAMGTSELRGKGLGGLPMTRALGQLGVTVTEHADGLTVEGVGLSGLQAPAEPLDLGRRAWAAAALTGVLAGAGLEATLHGDETALAGVLGEIARPIRLRGGQLEGQLDPAAPQTLRPPLAILRAPAPLSELQLEVAPGNYPAKVAALASGLYAHAETLLAEPVVSGDRFERLLRAVHLPVESAGAILRLKPAEVLPAFDQAVPGDSDGSLLLLAAALLVPDSRVGVRGVASGPSRGGALDALTDAGATLAVAPREVALGEPTADVEIASVALPRGLRFGGERSTTSGATLPTLAALAASLSSPSELFDLPPDPAYPERAPRCARLLGELGLQSHPTPDGLIVMGRGRHPLRAATLDPEGDPALALMAAVLGLAADGPCRIRNADAIVETFPRFVGSLRALGARIEVA